MFHATVDTVKAFFPIYVYVYILYGTTEFNWLTDGLIETHVCVFVCLSSGVRSHAALCVCVCVFIRVW